MKKLNIYSFFVLAILLLNSCRDESLNPIPEADFKDGVTFTAVRSTSAFLDLAKVDGDSLKFTTDTKRPDLIAKVDVWAELVPASGTKISKLMLTLPSTIGSYSIAYNDYLKALGINVSALKPGDILRAKFVVTTPDGRTFSEDNTVGTLPSTGSSAFTRSLNTTVACVYNAAQFATGTWTVKIDDWNDYKVGDEISVKTGPGANELTLGIFPTDGSHKDVVLVVTDANTGAVKVPKIAYGAYLSSGATIYSAEGTGSISGCAGTIDLVLRHTGDDGYSSGATPTVRFSLVRK